MSVLLCESVSIKFHTSFREVNCECKFSSVQSLSRVRLFATPWITARQASLSITNSRSSLRLTKLTQKSGDSARALALMINKITHSLLCVFIHCFSSGSAGKASACNAGGLGWENPWRRKWLPTPVFWPGEFQGYGIGPDWGTCTFPFVAQMVKNLPAMQETGVQSQGQEDLLEKGMATHCSILAWGIPWTEEPGRLQSMESQKVWHNWATNTFQLFCWKTSVCQVHTNEVCEKNPVHLYSRN